jgi:hypothetical protein
MRSMTLVALVLVLLGIGALIKQVATAIRLLLALLTKLMAMYLIVLIALVCLASTFRTRAAG